MLRMQVSEGRYELGDPPLRNYDAEMLLTAEMYLDGATRIILTTYLKEIRFHNMDKIQRNYNIMLKKAALLY